MKKLFILLLLMILLLGLLLSLKRTNSIPINSMNTNIPEDIKFKYQLARNKPKEDDYLLTLEIPKINVKREVFKVSSSKNNVNMNIKILKESDMPDKENGNIFFAAHRGNTKVSYFENLHKLIKGDKVIVTYKNKKYEYIIDDYFLTEKNGTITLNLDENKKSIGLITCSKEEKDKQIVFVGYGI